MSPGVEKKLPLAVPVAILLKELERIREDLTDAWEATNIANCLTDDSTKKDKALIYHLWSPPNNFSLRNP